MARDLNMEHGRLVGRLKRQLEKCERLGVTDRRVRGVRDTVRLMMAVERLRAMDDVQRAKALAKSDIPRMALAITDGEVEKRMTLMRPGAGIEAVSR